MYPIAQDIQKLFKENYRQVVRIICRGRIRTIELKESDILQGGLTIDRYCVSGNTVEIGSAIASELTLQLDNRDDRFSEEVFEGAELNVQIGVKKWDAYKWEKAEIFWLPCGYFTVDEPPRKFSKITLKALDRMVKFDVVVNPSNLQFPMSVQQLLNRCCENCGVSLSSSYIPVESMSDILSDFIGVNDDEITYRQIIQWIAERTGTCAYIDWEGKLRFEWYHDTGIEISLGDRYSSEIYEQNITITGVKISEKGEKKALSGTEAYAFNLVDNRLIDSDKAEAVANAIYEKVGGFTYRPMECTCRPMPYLYPLDKIKFIDKYGAVHSSIVTNIVFTVNAKTKISGKGETNAKRQYASANPLTRSEQAILEKLENRIDDKIVSKEQAALDMNELISNSLGLYRTITPKINGGETYYYHDMTNLSDSTVIYTFGANGFAWTDKWEGDNTVWKYGVTKDGNAILKYLSVNKLTADQIDATDLEVKSANIESLSVDKLTAGAYDGEEYRIEFQADGTLKANNVIISGIIANGKEALDDNGEGFYFGIDGMNLNDGFIVDRNGNTEIKKGKIDIGGTTENDYSKTSIKTRLSSNRISNWYQCKYFATGEVFEENVEISGGRIQLMYDCNESGYTYKRNRTLLIGMEFSEYQPDYMVIDANDRLRLSTNDGYGQLTAWIQMSPDDIMGKMSIYARSGYLDGTWYYESGELTSSDRNLKNSIEKLDDRYSALFDGLSPVRYKYNNGNSNRYHTGFIAQDVRDAILSSGLSLEDSAMFASKKITENGVENDKCYLRYSEIIALCVKEIQSLKKKVKDLEEKKNG